MRFSLFLISHLLFCAVFGSSSEFLEQTDTEIENLLGNSTLYIRDTIASDSFNFDLEKGNSGLYPISIDYKPGTIYLLFINSTSPIQVSFYKCGLEVNLGTIKDGCIGYDADRVLSLDDHFCGQDKKKQYLKLLITSEAGEATGVVEFREHTDVAWLILLLLAFIFCLLVLIVLCVTNKKAEKTDNAKTETDYHFYDYIDKELNSARHGTRRDVVCGKRRVQII